MINVVDTSDNFIKTFKLKEKCAKSDNGYAITFDDICEFLLFDKIIDI